MERRFDDQQIVGETNVHSQMWPQSSTWHRDNDKRQFHYELVTTYYVLPIFLPEPLVCWMHIGDAANNVETDDLIHIKLSVNMSATVWALKIHSLRFQV